MADAQFRIGVGFDVDTAGASKTENALAGIESQATKTASAMAEIKDSAADVSKSLSEAAKPDGKPFEPIPPKVKDDAKEAASAMDGLRDALHSVGGKGAPARDVLEGISKAASGGEGAVYGLAKAGHELTKVFETGTIGAGGYVAIIGAVIGVVKLLADALAEPKEQLNEFGQKGDQALASLKKLDGLKLNFDSSIAEIAAVKTEFDRARAAADALFASEKKLSDAKLGADLAKINFQKETAIANAGGDPAKIKAAEAAAAQAEIERQQSAKLADAERELAKLVADGKRVRDQQAATTQKLREAEEESRIAIGQRDAELRKLGLTTQDVETNSAKYRDALAAAARELQKANEEAARKSVVDPELSRAAAAAGGTGQVFRPKTEAEQQADSGGQKFAATEFDRVKQLADVQKLLADQTKNLAAAQADYQKAVQDGRTQAEAQKNEIAALNEKIKQIDIEGVQKFAGVAVQSADAVRLFRDELDKARADLVVKQSAAQTGGDGSPGSAQRASDDFGAALRKVAELEAGLQAAIEAQAKVTNAGVEMAKSVDAAGTVIFTAAATVTPKVEAATKTLQAATNLHTEAVKTSGEKIATAVVQQGVHVEGAFLKYGNDFTRASASMADKLNTGLSTMNEIIEANLARTKALERSVFTVEQQLKAGR